MSFSMDAKQEIIRSKLNESQAKAQLAAMVLASNNPVDNFNENQFSLSFSQVFIAKRYVQLIKQLYQVDCDISYDGKHKLTKTSLTTITIREKIKLIIEDIGLYHEGALQEEVLLSRITKEDDLRAYLAGWFLVKGSVSDPNTSNYHLEIRTSSEQYSQHLLDLFAKFRIHGKLTKRRHEFLFYLKASEKISDVLRVVGAHQALLLFEDVRIHRDFHNSLTRLDNCEVSNEMKSIAAGQRQVAAIEKLKIYKRFDHLEQRLQDVALIRLRYPEHSLKELADEYYHEYRETISKSGMKHRLDKLVDVASRIND